MKTELSAEEYNEYKQYIINELKKFDTFGTKLTLRKINEMKENDRSHFATLVAFLNSLKEENVVLPSLRDWYRHFKD